jgi:hypothetical protein
VTPVDWFFHPRQQHDPRSHLSLSGGENELTGVAVVDFDAILAQARRNWRCAECGVELDRRAVPVPAFCCAKHRYAFRDRRRYAENPELERAKSRRYYAENRERVLAKAAARRGKSRLALQVECSECGGLLEGRQRVVCSPRCRDARYRRLHPESYAECEARKVERRRERRQAARSEADGS